MSKLYFQSVIDNVVKIHSAIEDRSDMLDFRKASIEEFTLPLVKNAFDTRRINQETEYNPRRNLQNYHRSEPFITKDASENIKILFKLKNAVDNVKESFNNDPDYLDSYCRILSNALDRTLRMDQKDMDFSSAQMNYLNELLYLRYRLAAEDITKFDEKELQNIILDRDEKLKYKTIYAQYDNKDKKINAEVSQRSDSLTDRLFGNVKASSENKEVERTITIKINDQIKNDDIKKEG